MGLRDIDFIEIPNDLILFEGTFDSIAKQPFLVFKMPFDIRTKYCKHPYENKDLWIYGLGRYNQNKYSTHYMRPLCNEDEFYNLPLKVITDIAYGAYMDGEHS